MRNREPDVRPSAWPDEPGFDETGLVPVGISLQKQNRQFNQCTVVIFRYSYIDKISIRDHTVHFLLPDHLFQEIFFERELRGQGKA